MLIRGGQPTGGILPNDHLQKLSYKDRESSVRDLLSQNNTFGLVAEHEDGEIMGFSIAGPERFQNPLYKAEIYSIYVLKSYQRQNIGRDLFYSTLKKLEQLGFFSVSVWVLADNPYKKFYDNNGGQLIDTKIYDIDGFKATFSVYGWSDIRGNKNSDL